MFHDNNTFTSGVGPIVDVLLVARAFARSTSCVTADGSQRRFSTHGLSVLSLSSLSFSYPFLFFCLPSKVWGVVPDPVTKAYLYNLRPGTVLVAQEEFWWQLYIILVRAHVRLMISRITVSTNKYWLRSSYIVMIISYRICADVRMDSAGQGCPCV